MRGRFALVGAGVILLAVGCVKTVATQDAWLDGYGIIAYFLAPLAFIPLAAVFVASPRANRFVESVFTAPVERSDWLTAWWGNARAQCVHDNVMESAQETVYVRPLTGPVKPSTDRGYLGLRCLMSLTSYA